MAVFDDNTNGQKVLTAPLALIKIGTTTVGKIRNIRLQEQFQRGDVRGIGVLISSEKPILAINCIFTCSSYVISISKLGTIDNPFVVRNAPTRDTFVNTVLLQDNGVDIYVFKKGAKQIENGIVKEIEEQDFLVIKNAFLDSQSFNIDEGQIAGSDLSGSYLDPAMISQ